jgi:hypothetical protein
MASVVLIPTKTPVGLSECGVDKRHHMLHKVILNRLLIKDLLLQRIDALHVLRGRVGPRCFNDISEDGVQRFIIEVGPFFPFKPVSLFLGLSQKSSRTTYHLWTIGHCAALLSRVFGPRIPFVASSSGSWMPNSLRMVD